MVTIETINRSYLMFTRHSEDGSLIEKKKISGDFNEVVNHHGGSSNASWRQVGNEHWTGREVQSINFPIPQKGSIPPKMNKEGYVKDLIRSHSPF